MIRRINDIFASLTKRFGLRGDWYLVALAAGIGTITAFGAIAFIELLHKADHLALQVHRSAPGWILPLVPMTGALITGILVYLFAREAKGHGVPEVMDSLFRQKAIIKPRVALTKFICSISTIGSGGSAGAEGPIVQIGAAIGSTISRTLHIPRDYGATLLGCGAAAGIASVFNAPIAGVFFVLEILLRDFSLRTFTPIVVSAVFSTAVTQAWYGENDAIFAVTGSLTNYEFSIPELPVYLLLGLICGAVAVGFIRALYFTEDLFEKLKIHPIIKPVLGVFIMALLGIGYLVMVHDESGPESLLPPFFGNGYETIRSLLDPAIYLAPVLDPQSIIAPVTAADAPFLTDRPLTYEPVTTTLVMLAVLLLCKAVATCLTLGSGGSGGVFAPSLFLGAATGATFGVALQQIGLLPPDGSPAAYALVGMAAVVAGTTHAPLTAILILFELTRDVYVLLPIMLAAVVSVLLAQALLRDSIYSLKLRRRGLFIGTAADLTILRRLTVRSIAPIPHVEVHPEDPLSKLSSLRGSYHIADFIVTDHEGRYVGMVTGTDMRTALMEPEAIPYLLVEELLRRDLPTIHPEDTLDTVLEKFSKHDVASLPLLRAGSEVDRKVTGLITRARLMHRYHEELAKS